MDEGKQKKKKKNKKKHRHSKSHKSEKPELKVTTQGEGADTPVWTHPESPKDSISSSDSHSEGDSGMGSSIQPRLGTDTESRGGAALRLSPDATKEPVEDDSLSDRGDGDGDQDMPDANEQQGEGDPAGFRLEPTLVPDEGAQLCDNQDEAEAGDDGEPQEPQEPLEPYQIVLQGFRTVSQTLSVAYGAASAEIQIIVRKSLAKTQLTTEPLCGEPLGPFARLCQASNGLFGEEHPGASPTTGGCPAGRKGCPQRNPSFHAR